MKNKKNLDNAAWSAAGGRGYRRPLFCTAFSLALLTCSMPVYSAWGGVNEPLPTEVQQSREVTGRVVDELGEPMIGVSVVIPGTSQGAITDLDGNFKLSVPTGTKQLRFTYMGYKPQTVAIAAGRMTVKMELDNQQLDEVVVVGYGVQKKSDVTGAMASVGTEELNARPVNNAFEALQGKAAGVDITTNERPGSIGSIRIRGNRSISASNDPLYVVDGVPLMSASAIETLNPRDIESIDVLKDASATAIYGSRGANGVILVTTKQGKSGKFSLDYSGTVTFSDIVDHSKSMNAAEYINYRRWAAYNVDPEKYADPRNPTRENDMLIFDSPKDGQTMRDNVLQGWANGTWDPSRVTNTDWTDFVTQTGISTEHTISASGGTEQLNGYGSFGYLRNDGTQKGQWYSRYTGKMSVNLKPTKWFTMNMSLNVTWSERDYGMSTLGAGSGSAPDAIYGRAKGITNIAVPYDSEGNLVINPTGENGTYTIIDEWDKTTQQSQMFRALGSFSATFDFGEMWKPLEGLRYKINFGPDYRNWREGSFIDAESALKIQSDGKPGTNWARLSNQRDFSWTLDNMITFDRTFADKHKVGVTLLQTASSWNVESSSMNAQNIAIPASLWNAFGSIDVTNSDNKAGMGSGITERQLMSYMVRVNYGFNERYLLTVSGRWDGASQLAPGHQWDFFPSAALAWRVNQESFLQDVEWLDNLKVRFGVGTTGNAAVSPYATKGDITSFYLPFNGIENQLGYSTNEPYYMRDQLTMANDKLGWEKTTQYNFGIDFGVLHNRLSGSVDVYFSRTNDLLMKTNIPTLTGFPSTFANVGKTKNHGVEVTLNAIPVQLDCGFTWESNLNMAYQKDEIVELAYGKNDMVDNSWFIGESIGVFYGYDNLGLWQDTPEDHAEMDKWREKGTDFEPGMVRPKDQDGNYEMNSKDRVILGNKSPKWTMGWTNNFSWKGIELGISLYGRMGYMINGVGLPLVGRDNVRSVNYWTPDNPGADFQKPILSDPSAGSRDSYYSLLGYKDAAFVKIRNISVGYNFPKQLANKWGLEHLKVYGQAVNPGSIYDSVDDYDLDTGKTYYNRSFVIGLELGF